MIHNMNSPEFRKLSGATWIPNLDSKLEFPTLFRIAATGPMCTSVCSTMQIDPGHYGVMRRRLTGNGAKFALQTLSEFVKSILHI